MIPYHGKLVSFFAKSLNKSLKDYILDRKYNLTMISSYFKSKSVFRFDMDFDDDVLYCYEIQLEPEVRRKGLGQINIYFSHRIKTGNQE